MTSNKRPYSILFLLSTSEASVFLRTFVTIYEMLLKVDLSSGGDHSCKALYNFIWSQGLGL